ncbi:MAG: hypothetical protein KDC34_14810 [Saprospiraceae bacterium]|nr:hypothetical protein [Saprospiraceae bacterium]
MGLTVGRASGNIFREIPKEVPVQNNEKELKRLNLQKNNRSRFTNSHNRNWQMFE